MKLHHKISKKHFIQVLAVTLVLFAAVVLAKYIQTFQTDHGVITSEKFYFTVDLISDSKMAAGSDGLFSLKNTESGTWHLYGGGQHTVDFSVRNYYDDLRITRESITYSAKVEAADIPNVNLTAEGEGGNVTGLMTLGEKSEAEDKYTKTDKLFHLTIPENYTEETTVKVTIQSTSPYKKTIELSFVVHPAGEELTYEVVDSMNSPYAELIIRNGTSQPVRPVINWSSTTLSIDNTNELTFVYGADNTFTIQPDMESREMQVSREIKSGESVSIYFFKSDSKNYSQVKTLVASDNKIVIRDSGSGEGNAE
ncbi:hypothetical protein ABXS75_03695 [Roseburia hominis]